MKASESSPGPDRGSEPSRPKIELPLALSKVPAGRHQVPREILLESQRARLLAAALDVFAERGFVKTSVAALIKEAGTSRATFYSLYPDKAACFLATYDLALERLGRAALGALDGPETWPRQVRAVTASLLAALAEDPRLARLCAVEVDFAGPETRARREEMVGKVSAGLRRGRRGRPDLKKLTDLFEPALVGGASALIACAVADGEAGSLAGLAPELTELVLCAYLGAAEARRVARGR